MRDPLAVVRQMVRAVKPGGRVVLADDDHDLLRLWPEPPGAPYMRPPAYMAYPPFNEPHWRYEYLTPQKYYRGFHFWLDQF